MRHPSTAVRVLVVGVLLAALALPALPAPSAEAAPLLPALLDRRLAEFSGGAGVFISDPLRSSVLYAHDSHEVVITGSVYKLAVLLEAERRVEAGTLRYEDAITIEPEDVTEDGSFEPAGAVLTVDEALEQMITVSDNGSALALEHTFGAAAINVTLASFDVRPFHLAESASEDNTASALAVGRFFELLARKQLVSAAASDRMLRRLERQKINDRLPAQLPEGTVVAHKTGNLGFATHDAGIIYAKGGEPLVVVALTWDSSEAEAVELIQDIGSLVYANALTLPTNAGFSLPQQRVVTDAGRALLLTVRVTNLGATDWNPLAPDPFTLVWDMRDANNTLVARSAAPIVLGSAQANESVDLPVVFGVPSVPGEYTVSVGIADRAHGPLAALGAATGSFTIRAHPPFLVSLEAQVPSLLHRDEASPAFVGVGALDLLSSEQAIALGWRVVDPRTGRVVAQGSTPLGSARPGERATRFGYLVAPSLRGSYTLELFAVIGGQLASTLSRRAVVIAGPRTYGDEPVVDHAPPASPRRLPGPTRAPTRSPGEATPAPSGR